MRDFLLALVLSACMTSAHAASIDASASLVIVFTDTGGSNWAGAMIGDIYSSSIQSPDDATDATATICIVDECQYEFSALSPAIFSISLTDGDTFDSASAGNIVIWNNYNIEEDDAQFLSDMGLGGVLPEGTLVDGWWADATFSDGSDVFFGWVSTDISLYSDLAYRNSPSGISEGGIGLFTLEDGSDFLAAGTTVPIPAGVWLFGSALGLLGWARRKKA